MAKDQTIPKLGVVGALLVLSLGGLSLLKSTKANESDRGAKEGPTDTEAPPTAKSDDGARGSGKDPRLVLRRPWFDKLPQKRTDEIELWIFMGGGYGIHDKGSVYRSTIDFFDFERQGSKVEIVFLQDKKKQSVPFEIVPCHDKPEFDLCLDLKEPLRGHTRLWSWDDDADMDRHVPWAKEWRASAEARARGAR